MPLELQIIHASDFIRLDPRSHLDFDASCEALYTIALACRKRGIDRALLDLRNLPIPEKPLFTREELSALVGSFHDAGFTRYQRLAVLYRQDPHRGVRKFAFLSTLKGWSVRAFSDFEKALFWLSELHQPQHSDAIPVHFRSSKRRLNVECQ